MHSPVYSPGLAEALYEQLTPQLPGISVELLGTCDSTNTRLLAKARGGDTTPTLLVTETQTAGRGRMGRQWLGQPGDCLMFSLGLTLAPQDWSGLSLVVGWALADALHPSIRIKWPNDLWVDGKKLAGILIETANVPGQNADQRYAVIGCGINIAPVADAGLRTAPTHLQALVPQASAASALASVAAPLLRAVLAFEHLGFAPWQERFNQRDALAGLSLNALEGERVLATGMAHGVNASGALLVHTWDGMKEITSGEVSIRPA
jgi:BirA family biotin operon repressor/biotin-[acetyl-CoA-carboxylase] ligase